MGPELLFLIHKHMRDKKNQALSRGESNSRFRIYKKKVKKKPSWKDTACRLGNISKWIANLLVKWRPTDPVSGPKHLLLLWMSLLSF